MGAQLAKRAIQADYFLKQRSDPRIPLVMHTAKLLCETGEYVCMVRDISSGGVRIRLFHDLPPDEFLFLELANGERFALERRWHSGDEAGFRFASSIDVDEFIDEPSLLPRRPLRVRLDRTALVTADGEDSGGMLINLSQQGAAIETNRAIAKDVYVRLEVDGLPILFGHVRWREGNRHGLALQKAFRLEEFARHAFALQPHQGVVADGDNGKRAAFLAN